MSSSSLIQNDLCYRTSQTNTIHPTVITAVVDEDFSSNPTVNAAVSAWINAVDNTYGRGSVDKDIHITKVTDDFTDLLIRTADGYAIPLSVGLENFTDEYFENLNTLYLKITEIRYSYDSTEYSAEPRNCYLPIDIQRAGWKDYGATGYASGLLELARVVAEVTDAEHPITSLWDVKLTVEGVYERVDNKYRKLPMVNKGDILPNICIWEDE